ncbi:MAG: LamG-like jellyroll fold domain-containing protein, partial [Candidatus Woesearchaeota archaeon]
SLVRGEWLKIKAWLTDENNLAVANEEINFYLANELIGTEITDSEGFATIAWNTSSLEVGSYLVNVNSSTTVDWSMITISEIVGVNETEEDDLQTLDLGIMATPTQGTPILNSTNLFSNDTNENLTVYNVSFADGDSNRVKGIINWRINGTPVMVLNMPFEGVNSTLKNNTYDYSGFFNNGSEVSEPGYQPTWNATGGFDGRGAYEFDSDVGEAIDVNNRVQTLLGNYYSVEAWIRPTGLSNRVDGCASQADTGAIISYAHTSSRQPRLFHLEQVGSSINFMIGNDTSTTSNDRINVTKSNVLTVNTWHHVVGVRNNTNVTVYVDGEIGSSNKTQYPVGTITVDNLKIGVIDTDTYGPVCQPFNGTIDEVRIWNRSLTGEQILALYNNRTDLIVSQETKVNENWTAEIVVNDGDADGQAKESNSISILQEVKCRNIDIDTSLYENLTFNSANSIGACFNITASHITIDGRGYAIIGNATGWGINSSGVTNVTIKNLFIRNFTRGINAYAMTNSTIINNTIVVNYNLANGYGILLNNSDNNNITSNAINTTGLTGYGIWLDSSSDNNLSLNSIVTIGEDAFGIYTLGNNRTTILSNQINTSSSSADAIYLVGSNNSNIIANNINASGHGIFLNTNSFDNNISFNNVTTTISGKAPLKIQSSSNNTIFWNNFTSRGSTDGLAVYLLTATENTFSFNILTSSGGTPTGFWVSTESDSNTFTSNKIITSGSGSQGRGIVILSGCDKNLFLNNNISSSWQLISDISPSSDLNYLIYNNSFGEIKWINNGTGSFLENLTLNVSNDQGIGLGRNIFIGNNTAALNTTAFTAGLGRINSTANITLKLTGLADVLHIKRVENYTTTGAEIQNAGTDCNGGTCEIISYSNGILLFNTSFFSSFSADGNDTVPPNVTELIPARETVFNTSLTIEIGINVTETNTVSNVSANITLPNGSVEVIYLGNMSGHPFKYNNSYLIPSLTGTFNVTFFANDTSNIVNSTEITNFTTTLACGTITNDVSLNQNITASGTCLAVGAKHITINGSGYAITGDGGTSDYGITIYNTSNITIKNFAGIDNFKVGIHAAGLNDSTFFNNSIEISATPLTPFGIALGWDGAGYLASKSNNISSNIINGDGSTTIGIRLVAANYTIIRANIINTTGVGGANGIELVSSSSFNNISFNNITTFSSSSDGISITTAASNNLSYNRITTHGSNSFGIYAETAPGSEFSFNNITTFGDAGLGFYLLSSEGINISGNIIITNGSTAYGIYVVGTNWTTITSNQINISGTSSHGIYLLGSNNSNIIANSINTSGNNGNGIVLDINSDSNLFLNNNVTSTNGYIILDLSISTDINYLIYNNSFGEIKWINNGSGSFLENLTLNVSNDQGIGLGRNIFIGNNTAALNTTAFTAGLGRINGTANITLKLT